MKCATCSGLYWACEDVNDNGESKDCETTCFISHAGMKLDRIAIISFITFVKYKLTFFFFKIT